MSSTWRGRNVLLTGHTGFIGGWLSLALQRLGARVHGFALAPPTEPSFFVATGLSKAISSDTRGDVRDTAAVSAVCAAAAPEIVLHLAAQPIVRRAWAEPAETFDTNVMGTVRVLDAVRATTSVKAVVVMTTDKVYANREWPWAYRETDRLGGSEPYSASKAATELVVDAYRKSYLDGKCTIATVRAGNVIGGGDWAVDRIIPDAVRAFTAGVPLSVRNPNAVRPWQNVIDVVAGLIAVAEDVAEGRSEAWNLAPRAEEQVSVGELVDGFTRAWGGTAAWRSEISQGPKETHLLRIDASKARQILGWAPRLTIEDSIARSCRWYQAQARGEDMLKIAKRDLEEVLS